MRLKDAMSTRVKTGCWPSCRFGAESESVEIEGFVQHLVGA